MDVITIGCLLLIIGVVLLAVGVNEDISWLIIFGFLLALAGLLMV